MQTLLQREPTAIGQRDDEVSMFDVIGKGKGQPLDAKVRMDMEQGSGAISLRCARAK